MVTQCSAGEGLICVGALALMKVVAFACACFQACCGLHNNTLLCLQILSSACVQCLHRYLARFH